MAETLNKVSEILEQYPEDMLGKVNLVTAARRLLDRDDGHYPLCPENFDPVRWRELLGMNSQTRAGVAAAFLIIHVEEPFEDDDA